MDALEQYKKAILEVFSSQGGRLTRGVSTIVINGEGPRIAS